MFLLNMKEPADTRFFEAVSDKNYEAVEKLFYTASTDAHRFYMKAEEFTPLHCAHSAGMVEYCISSGLDVNVRHSETDETPLLTAVKLNKPTGVIRQLLKRGASVEVRNKHTLNTPLIQAIHIVDCRPANVQALLENGADPNTVNKYGVTPLHLALRNFRGDVRIVEQLLKWGADVNCENSDRRTPLSIAVENCHCTAALLILLLKFNAKVELENIRNAMTNHPLNLHDIMVPLLQYANITIADAWSDILRSVLFRNNGRIIKKCGKLVIKQAFLQCSDPHKALVDTLLTYLNREVQLREYRQRRNRGINAFYSFREPKGYGEAELKKLKSFADDCFSEIKQMKEYKLEKNTSLYQLVVSKSTKLCHGNEIIKRILFYPIYCDTILSTIRRAALISKLMLQEVYTVMEHGNISLKTVLDPYSVAFIAEYLDEDEIKIFVDAFCNTSENYSLWDELVKVEASLTKKKSSNIKS